MCSQREILEWMAAREDPLIHVADVTAQFAATKRKRLFAQIGDLLGHGHIAVVRGVKVPRLGQNNRRPMHYSVTPEGRAFLASGKKHAKGPHSGPPRSLPDTLRDRIWTALVLARRASVADLVEVAIKVTDGVDRDKQIKRSLDNAGRYLKALCRAGIVKRAGRAEGSAPTSNGFNRYQLLRDLGPLAPVTGGKDVFDPNNRERIAYSLVLKPTSKKKERV